MKLSLLKELPVTSTLELCKEVANFAKNTENSSSLPRLELLLYNGIFITGRIIGFQENSGKPQIWIENNIDIPEKISVFLLEINQIIGINIIDFEVYQICKETSKPVEIIGALELKRKKKGTEELLESFLEKPIAVIVDLDHLKEEDRALVYKNLSLMTTAFQEILSDEMCKSIVHQNMKAIEIQISEGMTVTLDEEILSISIQNKNVETAANQIKILKEKIESVF